MFITDPYIAEFLLRSPLHMPAKPHHDNIDRDLPV